MQLSFLNEIIFASISACLLVVYHLLLYRRVRQYPLTTAIGVTDHARRIWVRSVMDRGRDILAIQTLRNWVMAATFLASTAILISLGLLTSAFRSDLAEFMIDSLNLLGHPNTSLWMFKLLVLAALFFYSFFNFTLSIRYYNHTALLINVTPEEEPSATVETVTATLNHGALHYTLGMRGFYLAVPMGLWLFGPLWFLLGSLLIVYILFRVDREV
jgi:uncharacterized membrane protein